MTDEAFDFTDPVMDAYRYSEAVADELGDEAVEGYFERLVDELFELVPGLKERFSYALLTALKEELADHEDAVRLIETVEAKWRSR